MDNIKDSYEIFLKEFGIDEDKLNKFGLDHIEFGDKKIVEEKWKELQNRLKSNQVVKIRKAGREGKLTDLYIKFANYLFPNSNIEQDGTNNYAPYKIVKETTGLRKFEKKRKDNSNTVRNYQISHIFSNRTKNPLLFEASWNIIYAPKIIDPLTGHESSGKWGEDFSKLLQNKAIDMYRDLIKEYNKIIDELKIDEKIQKFIDEQYLNVSRDEQIRFKKGVGENYKKIDI